MLPRWHRRFGLLAALFVVVAALSGVALNHSEALGLAQRHVGTPWLLRWWGIALPRLQAQAAWPLGPHWLSQCDQTLYLDAKPLPGISIDSVRGALAQDGFWLLADRRALLVLTPEGQQVDRLAYPHGFEARRLGRLQSPTGTTTDTLAQVRIAGVDGQQLQLTPDAAALQAAPAHATNAANAASTTEEAAAQWAAPGAAPEALQKAIIAEAARRRLSLERVLIALHSGHWMGRYGHWIMDAAAVLLVFLALSGSWLGGSRGARGFFARRWHRP